MKKKNGKSLGRIHRSNETLSVRIQNIEQRSEDKYEKMRGIKRMREEGGMRGIERKEIIEDMKVGKERKGLRE